ncbi:MAG: M48 family metallopeptidase [Xanthomonadales bacterium]|nr:M48 family metallopeptidase [Xanthomonadales bacterium]
MNFFEHQEQARRQSYWLIAAFIVAVLGIVVAIDAILLLALGVSSQEPPEGAYSIASMVRANLPMLIGGAGATLAVIGIASLVKTVGLRSGGGQVARQLGGTLVDSDTRDPKRRRLVNVVEEIALAAGVPVPDIYILEQESGINAFAAGYTPSDAAIAVTRGMLDKLDRNELQGVIAHEFSHIMNGDMRINIRLMGALFGILLLALIGRRVLLYAHLGRSSRNKNGGAVMLIAFGLVAAGYIGLFFGRWIKAAVSRQREYLADASAVQFTRDPTGIGGALKKIAIYSGGSHLDADSEEVSHMLFGDGQSRLLFATHPPLNTRIARIDPSFQPEDLERLASKLERERLLKQQAPEVSVAPAAAGGLFDADGLLGQIGNPDGQRVLMAAALAISIPEKLREAAHSAEWAPEVLFLALLDEDPELREQQLLLVAQGMGSESEGQLRALLTADGLPGATQRLPLLEMAFPALKRRPPEFVNRLLETVEAIAWVDGRIDVFEYLLARVISQHLRESANPGTARVAGGKSLAQLRQDAANVLAVLASHGHDDATAADAAFRAGMKVLGGKPDAKMMQGANWVKTMDEALGRLDALKPVAKQKLVRALAETVLYDEKVAPVELELLRVSCGLIHVPLPLLTETG